MREREKVYFWTTWLTPLLSGESSCEWKVWLLGHFQGVEKIERDFDSAQWNENHTAYLTELRDEYAPKSATLLTEGQTAWRIEGKTAIVAGKMDLVSIKPNLVIDAKTGKSKNSHVGQMKIYLLALTLGSVAAAKSAKGAFKGVLRYQSGSKIDVPAIEPEFKQRFFELVRRLAGDEMEPTPSAQECKFCDIASCTARITEESFTAKTNEF